VPTPAFALNYDYRCPFARIMHEHLVLALRGGAAFDVTFEPFTLTQGHVPEGQPAVWDDPTKAGDLLALETSLAVRDHFAEAFVDLHQAFFDARHNDGNALRTREQVDPIVASVGLDPAAVADVVARGDARREIAETWTRRTTEDQVFGVPTFFVGDQAVFVRYMERPTGDADASRALIAHLVDMVANQPAINEFKHTTLPR
jgi:protein-disulfide isomerase-like protein with CxxC motif